MTIDFIIKWFTEHSTEGEEVIDNVNNNYLTSGYIDSFGFLELISTCEDKFNINFTDEDFSNDEIFTIRGLADIINAKLEKSDE